MKIPPESLKIEVVGARNVCVRVTHLPTRTVAQVGCYDNEIQNRECAMEMISMGLFGIYSDAGKLQKNPAAAFDYGSFQCRNCLFTFPRADLDHGAKGYCTQCEVALGITLLHDNDEANRREQLRTKAAVTLSMLAHRV